MLPAFISSTFFMNCYYFFFKTLHFLWSRRLYASEAVTRSVMINPYAVISHGLMRIAL